MNDIVARLRDAASDLAVEAADEIEQLREQLAEATTEVEKLRELWENSPSAAR
jgi:hypothetical protein